jgi:hypothetical protein
MTRSKARIGALVGVMACICAGQDAGVIVKRLRAKLEHIAEQPSDPAFVRALRDELGIGLPVMAGDVYDLIGEWCLAGAPGSRVIEGHRGARRVALPQGFFVSFVHRDHGVLSEAPKRFENAIAVVGLTGELLVVELDSGVVTRIPR